MMILHIPCQASTTLDKVPNGTESASPHFLQSCGLDITYVKLSELYLSSCLLSLPPPLQPTYAPLTHLALSSTLIFFVCNTNNKQTKCNNNKTHSTLTLIPPLLSCTHSRTCHSTLVFFVCNTMRQQ